MRLLQKFYMPDPPGGGGPSKEDLKNAEELKQIYTEMRDTLRSIGDLFQNRLSREAEELGGASERILKRLGRDLNKELEKAVKETDKIQRNTELTSKGLLTAANVERQIEATKARQEKIANLLEEIQLHRGELNEAEQAHLQNATKQLEIQLAILNNQYNTIKGIEKAIGRYGDLMKGINKIPILGSLINAPKIIKKMEEAAKKGKNSVQVLGVGISRTFESIGFGLITAAVTKGLQFIYKSVIQLDKKVFELAKNLGVSADQAKRLTDNFVNIASSSANAGLMAKDLAKTYTELSNAVGFLVPSNKEFLETATLIQKRIGASAEDMSALAMQATLSGKTLRQTYATIEASRQVEGARNKLSLSTKQILDGIAKTSSAVLINFKGSVEALANAVIRATKLGTTLDQVNKQGESLLDFETSIQKEFEAQILTGRDINLTRARELALLGDTAGLMEELNRQQVTYDSFMNENVIARRAEAEAVGLSVEELSKKLLLQKQANQLGAKEGQSLQERYNELVKSGATQAQIIDMLGDKQAAADLQKASRAEKFEAAIERLKDIIGKALEPTVGGLVDKFQAFVGDTQKMNRLAASLSKVFSFIATTIERLPSILSAALTITKALASASIARAVASIVAAAGMTGPGGLLIAGAAGLATYNWLSGLIDGAPGAPPTVSATGGGETMTQPVNPALATTPVKETTTSQQAPVFKFNVNTIVGTENWSRQSRTSMQQDFGTTLQ